MAVNTVVVLSLTLGPTRVAGAQLRATVDVGGASVRYADSVRLRATTIAPSLQLDAGPITGHTSGTMSLLGAGGWSSQGAAVISGLYPARGVAQLELVADAGGSLHEDRTRTGRYLGGARLHAGSATRGLWLGGGAGQTWDGASWGSVMRGDAGVWARIEPLAVVTTLTPTAVGDSIRYTDIQTVVRWEGIRTDVALSGGLRAGDALMRESASQWGSISATLWVVPRIGLVADAGSYPVDFTQGFPGGRYVSVALRIAPHRRAGPAAPPSSASNAHQAASPNAELEVTARADGRRGIRVRARYARLVEIMSDFTGWRPVRLDPAADGWWTLVMPITPGTYQMNVRIDGGAWIVPGGTMRVVDEFGSPVGLAVVR